MVGIDKKRREGGIKRFGIKKSEGREIVRDREKEEYRVRGERKTKKEKRCIKRGEMEG